MILQPQPSSESYVHLLSLLSLYRNSITGITILLG